ncbi:P-loop containing nucleoside triphosphate hydrolase protein [Boletus reticuloceps]|uniref:P-loop containing nucleoside triphosphate hydrolase protein n=1 Tax=Boletus reticuloceps TaxID=495285 RepID=A0A8I2YG63_9AGAM|nr:P-loop containing nucleoside triphosphate hydrolase protein [Boletus reticuloceps]
MFDTKSSSALVTVNFKHGLNMLHSAHYRDPTGNKTSLPPHIFQLINNAYHMRRSPSSSVVKLAMEVSNWVPCYKAALGVVSFRLQARNPGPCSRICHQIKIQYQYLGHHAGTGTRTNGLRDDDANHFEQLKMALKSIGLSKRHVAQICQLVAAILHLSNIKFTIDRSCDMDAAVARNVDILGIVAKFLSVQPPTLKSMLAYKMKLVKRELCTIFLNTDGASDNRDDPTKTLYTLLFVWLNEHINQCLCRDDFDTVIGLFDLPGPQHMTSHPNSFDQFCINFTNERYLSLHPLVPYFNNTECVHTLQNKPGGLIHIMDDQARWSHKKTDLTMVEAFGKRWGNHSSFNVRLGDRLGFPMFTINHSNGPMSYASEGFLERNLGSLNPDFVSLLSGSLAGALDGAEGLGSANPFVKGLFSAKDIATQAHPKNGTPSPPLSSPSSQHIPRQRVIRAQSSRWQRSVRIVLLKNKNGKRMMCQIWSLGLTEVWERNVNVFEMSVMDGSAKEKVKQTGNVLGLQETDIVLRQYKVFLSQVAFHSVEDRLHSLDVVEQKRNCLCDAEAEAGLDVHSIGNPYAPYASPGLPPDDYKDPYNQVFSQAHIPLMANTSPFQHGNLYNNAYEDCKSFRSDDFNNRSQLTSNQEATNSNYGSESYAPSRNMFQNADKED